MEKCSVSRPDPSDDHCHREVTTVAESSRSVRGSEDHSVHGLALKTESSLAGRTSCRHCPCPHCWLRTGRCRGDARAPRDLTSPAKNNATLGSQPSAAPRSRCSPPLRASQMRFAVLFARWPASEPRVSMAAIFMPRFMKAAAGLMNYRKPMNQQIACI